MSPKPSPKTNPRDGLPSGFLVFYEESRGVRQPEVKMFNPSPGIEEEVNEWIRGQPDLIVHRIDWLPSGGLLGASVLHSRGGRGTEILRISAPGAAEQIRKTAELDTLGQKLLYAGAAAAFAALALFLVFYPESWYAPETAIVPGDLAVRVTVIAGGLAFLLTVLGLATVFKARLRAQ
jgi:hypothetical protein